MLFALNHQARAYTQAVEPNPAVKLVRPQILTVKTGKISTYTEPAASGKPMTQLALLYKRRRTCSRIRNQIFEKQRSQSGSSFHT